MTAVIHDTGSNVPDLREMLRTCVVQLRDPKAPMYMVLMFCSVCKWSTVLPNVQDVRTYQQDSPHVCQWRILPSAEEHEKTGVPKS